MKKNGKKTKIILKYTDFGAAKITKETKSLVSLGYAGSIPYMSTEMGNLYDSG